MISISRCRFFSSFSDRPTLGMNFKATTFQTGNAGIRPGSCPSWQGPHFPQTGLSILQLSTPNKTLITGAKALPRPLHINAGLSTMHTGI